MSYVKRILSFFLSFAVTMTVICGLFVFDASADIVITADDIESMVRTGIDAQATGNPASTYTGYTSDNCGRFVYGYCVNKSALGQKVRCGKVSCCTDGVEEFLQKDLGKFYFVWGAGHSSETTYTETYYYDRFASSTFVGSSRNFVIDHSFQPQRGDIMILGGSTNNKANGKFAHVGILISPTEYVDAHGNELRIYKVGYEGFILGYFRFNTDARISTGLTVPRIHMDKSSYNVGDTARITWDDSSNSSVLSHYWVNIRRAEDNATLFNDGKDRSVTYHDFCITSPGTYIITTSATPKGSVAGEGSETDTVTICVPDNVPRPAEEKVDFTEISHWSIGETTATIAGRVTYSVTMPSEVGVYMSKNGGDYYPAYYVDVKPMSNKTAKFTFPITGLSPGCGYDYKFYAKINGICYWSDVNAFRTAGTDNSEPKKNYVGVISDSAAGGLVLHSTPDYNDSSAIATMPIGSLVIVDPSMAVSGTTKIYVYYNGMWGYASKNYINTAAYKIDAGTFSASYASAVPYTGSAICPDTDVTYYGMRLRQGTDYTLQYINNINAGDAQIIIYGCGDLFTGSKTFSFRITGRSISDCTISSISDQAYTGAAIKPSVTVKYGSAVLENGTDYTVSYSGNTNAGTATVTVTGKGNYSGTKTASFRITGKSISDCTISSISDQAYTGTAIKPSVTVKYGSAVLENGTDYTVSYSGNTNAGTATVTVTGKGNYSGAKTASFRITGKSISDCTISSISDQAYTGTAIKPSVTVKYGSAVLENGTDYTVSYSGNTNAGTATVTVTGKGNYSGAKTASFRITEAAVPSVKAPEESGSCRITIKWKSISEAVCSGIGSWIKEIMIIYRQ